MTVIAAFAGACALAAAFLLTIVIDDYQKRVVHGLLAQPPSGAPSIGLTPLRMTQADVDRKGNEEKECEGDECFAVCRRVCDDSCKKL